MGTTYSDPSLLQADLVAGTTNVVSSAASTTIITIPAGRVWRGSISAQLIDTTAIGATFSSLNILTVGTNVAPAAGTILLQVIASPGGTGSEGNQATMNDVVVRAPAGNSVTINIQLSASAATLEGTASCNGLLVA